MVASLAQLTIRPRTLHAFVVAVPEKVAQPFNVELHTVERGKGRRLEGSQAAHDLLQRSSAAFPDPGFTTPKPKKEPPGLSPG